MKLTAAIVTSTVGRPVLRKAIESVASQTRKARHYIFVDGPQYTRPALDVIHESPVKDDTVVMNLPNNTGANLYTCSHINAMAPFIVTEDIVIYLDDDNWFEPEHVESIVGMVERHNLDWGSSLRNIVDNDGNHGCRDECESLSMFPNRSGQRHVDTSCLAVRRELGQKIASSWIVQRWMDRFAFQAIINARLRGGCTGKFTTNYRISDDGLGNMPIGHFKAYSEAIIRAHPMTPWRHEFVFEHAKQ